MTWSSSPLPCGLGRNRGGGRGEPDEFYSYCRRWRQAKPSVIRATSAQADHGSEQMEAGKSTRTVDVDEAERHVYSITNDDVLELARYAMIIEKHYGQPMDIEGAGWPATAKLILQARPETVKSQETAGKQDREVPSQAVRQGARLRPRHRPEDRRRPVRVVRTPLR